MTKYITAKMATNGSMFIRREVVPPAAAAGAVCANADEISTCESYAKR
jgi:hypothetical protein